MIPFLDFDDAILKQVPLGSNVYFSDNETRQTDMAALCEDPSNNGLSDRNNMKSRAI